MASLVAHWSNTTERFLRSTVFAAVSGKDTVTKHFCKMLTHCAIVQHMGRAWKTRKGDGARVDKEAKRQKLQQMLGGLSAPLLSAASPLSIEPMEEDMFGDLLCGEPMELNPCSDSIDNLLMMWEPMELVAKASQCSATVQPRTHALLGEKKTMDSTFGGAQFVPRRSTDAGAPI